MIGENISNVNNIPRWITSFLTRLRPDVCVAKVIKDGRKRALKIDAPLTESKLKAHFDPNEPRWYGGYPMLPGSTTTRLLMIDLDNHNGTVSEETMRARADLVMSMLKEAGYHPGLYRSSGGKGYHIYLFWQAEQDAYSVRQVGKDALARAGMQEQPGLAEIFPKQSYVPHDGYGNPIFLPIECSVQAAEDNPPVPVQKVEPSINLREKEGIALTPTDETMLVDALKHICADDYDTWIKVGLAIHHVTGGSGHGLELWEQWSMTSDRFEVGVCDAKWPTFNQNKDRPIGLGSIFEMARQNGWDMHAARAEKIEAQLQEIHATLKEVVRRQYDIDDFNDSDVRPVTISSMLRNLEPPFYLVENFLQTKQIIGVIGNPGQGKTMVWLDILLRVAAGRMLGERRVEQRRVVYVASENIDDVKLRVWAWCARHGVPAEDLDGWFTLLPGTYDIADPAGVQLLTAELKRWEGAPLGLVVIDTFSANFFGESENDAVEVSKWFNSLRQHVVEPFGCTAVVLGHPAKGAEDVTVWRGSGAVQGTLDGTFGVTIDAETQVVQLIQGKRRGPPAGELAWRIEEMETPFIDNFGKPVCTVVAVPLKRVRLNELQDEEGNHVIYEETEDGLDLYECGICYGIREGWPIRVIARRMRRGHKWTRVHYAKLKQGADRKIGERNGEPYLTALGKEYAAEAEKYLPLLFPDIDAVDDQAEGIEEAEE